MMKNKKLKNLLEMFWMIVGLMITSVLSANADIDYAKNNKHDKPYQLETLTGEKQDFFKFNESYKRSKPFNHNEVFNTVMSCFPNASNFDIDLDLKAGVKSYESNNTNGLTNQDKFYAELVFKMPLFSTAENSRVREQEYKRRQDISKLVANLSKSITDRNLSIRLIALYKSLERREQLRISAGVEQKKGSLITVDNQVKYLEKIAKQEQLRIEAIADIESAKLQLIAHCTSAKALHIDKYLTKVINSI